MHSSIQLFYFWVKSSVENPTSSSLPTDWIKVPYEGMDLRGSDIEFELMDDAESCQKACTNNVNCQFYTYISDGYSNPEFWYILFSGMQTVMSSTLLLPFFINYSQLWYWVWDAVVFFFFLCFKGAAATRSVPSPYLLLPKLPNWTTSCLALPWGTVYCNALPANKSRHVWEDIIQKWCRTMPINIK